MPYLENLNLKIENTIFSNMVHSSHHLKNKNWLLNISLLLGINQIFCITSVIEQLNIDDLYCDLNKVFQYLSYKSSLIDFKLIDSTIPPIHLSFYYLEWY
jgi:hypothetical protein